MASNLTLVLSLLCALVVWGGTSGASLPTVDRTGGMMNKIDRRQAQSFDVESDIDSVCAMMPNMIGCSLRLDCDNGRASGSFCEVMR